ncbi:alpha-l-rhamnosidase c [Ophiostoma piceae UAMH 11346]|uniref:Alpha-l-rhamnosidase c n=1 Tax=Ophiostoma piceae (strain UAMH 11346) TaxID=1262450 RepID=S3D291_OPHP1|nr:alpha-l-rhamnosidase c [Ophiostoma piceae UAMH 11346]
MGQPTTTSPLDKENSSPALPIEMVAVPADSYSSPFTSSSNNITPVTTVGQERRASVASNTRSVDSLPRRLSKSFQDSDMPRGFLAATADMTSSVVAAARPRSGTQRTRSSTLSESEQQQQQQPQSPQQSQLQRAESSGVLATLDEHKHLDDDDDQTIVANRAAATASSSSSPDSKKESSEATFQAERVVTGTAAAAAGAGAGAAAGAAATGDAELFNEYDNGYHFPPRYTTKESFMHGLRAFGHYLVTPTGFLIVLYGANIIAWGGMLFLLLCNASKAMCYPTCNNIDSPRRKWIEWDSQVLTGLFCVTAFGLAPWRFRDLYLYLQFKVRKNQRAMRRLAGVHRGWIRLPGSELLPITTGPGSIPADTPVHAIPFPETKIPDAPLTGQRAPPTRPWAIVFVLFMNIMNTILQAVLCGIMWGMNRYDRPSWSTGLFVALGCIAGALGGLGMFWEGKRVKGIEGVPLTDEDRQKLAHDREMGIYHYNNLSGKKPKEKTAAPDLEAGK